jgi:hypothetical protein
MRSSVGQIVIPSPHGKTLPTIAYSWLMAFIRWNRVLGLVAVHTPTIPLHIACMHHLPHLHSKLFILAHELVDREPESATSWYAVGVWYLTQKKWSEARTYFRCVHISGITGFEAH